MEDLRSRTRSSTPNSTSSEPSSSRAPAAGPTTDADTVVATAPLFAAAKDPRPSLRPSDDAERLRQGRERILIRRMQVASRAFILTLGAGAAAATLALPLNRDPQTLASLNEINAFGSAFDRTAFERSLQAHADAQSGLPLAKVAQRVGGRGVPKVTALQGSKPIAPYAKIELGSLAQVDALASKGATLSLEVPVADGIAEALGWRLFRLGQADRYVLEAVQLGDQSCSAADLKREHEVAQLREGVVQAQSAATVAEQKQLAAEKTYERLRKWKSSWKIISQANEKRVASKATLDQAQNTLMQAAAAYETAANAASRTSDSTGPAATCRIAIATLSKKGGGSKIELRLPAQVETRKIPAPKVSGVSFQVTKDVGLWPSVASDSAAVAAARLRGRFSWQSRYAELGSIRLGGATVLQLLPLFVVCALLWFIRSCRRVGATYNPFDSPRFKAMPLVGMPMRSLNAPLLFALPTGACLVCAWALVRIDQLALVPIASCFATIALGVVAHGALGKLLDLREGIIQTHSGRPEADSRGR